MLRESLVPLEHLWSVMLQRPVLAVVHEDNMSTITVIEAGYSPQLKNMNKQYRISLGLVHDMCKQPDIRLQHVDTYKRKGDLMTKGLQRPKHEPAMHMVGLCSVIVM